MTHAAPMIDSGLPLPLHRRGKVRDVYEVGDDRLLLVTTDRVSAFDVVMNEPIPYKGIVLTQLTAWWLSQLPHGIEHHLISADSSEIIRDVPVLREFGASIDGRAMLCKRTAVIPIECVIRGYLTGSAWKEYSRSGTLAGETLKSGYRECDRLAPPIFSPATKAESGHDENIAVSAVRDSLGSSIARELESKSRTIYDFGRAVAESKGIIVADTKFEFGWLDGRLVLIDEVLTPDSSRFWPADSYQPGRPQTSFDKQPLRDWLDRERQAGRWNGDAPPPALPPEVVDATSLRYLEVFGRITGQSLGTNYRSSPQERS